MYDRCSGSGKRDICDQGEYMQGCVHSTSAGTKRRLERSIVRGRQDPGRDTAAPGEAGAKHDGSWERVGLRRPFLNLNFSSKNVKTS